MTNAQLPIDDLERISDQQKQRSNNHRFSEHSKCPNPTVQLQETVNVGDIVYLYQDGDKHTTRPRYLVTSTDTDWCFVRKFIGKQLRNVSYRVKRSECCKVKAFHSSYDTPYEEDETVLDDEDDTPIPREICDITTNPSTPDEHNLCPLISNTDPMHLLDRDNDITQNTPTETVENLLAVNMYNTTTPISTGFRHLLFQIHHLIPQRALHHQRYITKLLPLKLTFADPKEQKGSRLIWMNIILEDP